VVSQQEDKLPEIKIELKDAKLDRQDLDKLVEDIAHLGKDKPS